MSVLLDVNVLVALAWPNHVHHAAASTWILAHHEDGWATCSITETGFVRVSSNTRAIPDARSPVEAAALLGALRQLGGHRHWVDDLGFVDLDRDLLERLNGHRQVTDAHLVMLARRHEGSLATFDAGAAALDPTRVVLLTTDP